MTTKITNHKLTPIEAVYNKLCKIPKQIEKKQSESFVPLTVSLFGNMSYIKKKMSLTVASVAYITSCVRKILQL